MLAQVLEELRIGVRDCELSSALLSEKDVRAALHNRCLHKCILSHTPVNEHFVQLFASVKSIRQLTFNVLKTQWSETAIDGFCEFLRKSELEDLSFIMCANVPEKVLNALYACKSLKKVATLFCTFEFPKKPANAIADFDLTLSQSEPISYREDLLRCVAKDDSFFRSISAESCRIKQVDHWGGMLKETPYFAEFLSKYRGVEQIVMSYQGVVQMCQSFTPRYPLKTLMITQGKGTRDVLLPSAAEAALCEFLAANRTLEEITLTNLSEAIGRAIAVGAGKTLKRLVVRICDLEGPFMAYLFAHLPNLAEWSMFSYEIKPSRSSVQSILNAIPRHVTSISMFHIACLQVQDFLFILRRPMKRLSLHSGTKVQLTGDEQEKFANLLRHNRTLRTVHTSISLSAILSSNASDLLDQSAFIHWTNDPRNAGDVHAFLNHRNRCILARATQSAIALICLRRFRRVLLALPKEIVVLIARELLATCHHSAISWSKGLEYRQNGRVNW
jgi:hypothetical protein